MEAVLAGLDEVGSALAAGLLPPRQADLLLYTLRQAGAALRWMARAQAGSARPLTAAVLPQVDDRAGASAGGNPQRAPGEPGLRVIGERTPELAEEAGKNQERLVDEYPGFEAEFGLPAGLDLSQPAHLLVPAGAQAWPSAAPATTPAAVYSDPPPRKPLWTKESIELEELGKRREYMSEKSFNEQSCKIHARIEKQVKTEFRKEREAEWQAEADRRNALEEQKVQTYRDMDEGQRRAYHLGILEGIDTAKRTAEEEERQRKPVKAAVDSSRIVGMGRLDGR